MEVFMTNQTILEHVKIEHQRLARLFGDCWSSAKTSETVIARNKLDTFITQLQGHITDEENILFPLYEKARTVPFRLKTDQLRNEHASLRELVSIIAQKQDQGMPAVEEQEAFHVLFINHIKNEESVIRVLDQFLSIEERESALAACSR
jgi:iron-sulfur cluster repair protein YtfE (RIC family)